MGDGAVRGAHGGLHGGDGRPRHQRHLAGKGRRQLLLGRRGKHSYFKFLFKIPLQINH